MNQGIQIKDVEVGIDWLTVTCADKEQWARLRHQMEFARERSEALGDFTKPWKWCGYEGWKMRGMRIGDREDGGIVVVSADIARKAWGELLQYTVNVTRVDLQLTIDLEVPYPSVAEICYKYLLWLKAQDYPLKYQQFSYVTSAAGGETLYIGSRSSNQYGRVYDKGIESARYTIPGYVWRYEVEFKQDYARSIAKYLYSSYLRDDDVSKRIGDTVSNWFGDREVPSVGDHWPKPYKLEVSAIVRDKDKTLEWFRRSVRPSVKRLLSAGVEHQQIELALGLPMGYE